MGWEPKDSNSGPSQSMPSLVSAIAPPNGKPALCSFFGCIQKDVIRPGIHFSFIAFAHIGRENIHQIDSGMLFKIIDARNHRIAVGADGGGNSDPFFIFL
jgi:hypothetical protein